MAFSRWEPFRELAAMQAEMRRLMNEVPGLGGEAREAEGQTWMPPVDAWETENDLVLAFDVPGVPPDRMRVEVDEGTLVVEGERERREDERGQRFHRLERRFGTYTRSIPLPPGIDEQQIRAEHRDGVLEVRVPKPRERQPRRIEVEGTQPSAGQVTRGDVGGTAEPGGAAPPEGGGTPTGG